MSTCTGQVTVSPENLLPVSWSQLLYDKPVNQITTKLCQADASHSPMEELPHLCTLQIWWKWEGHTLSKGCKDAAGPLVFVRLEKAIPFE